MRYAALSEITLEQDFIRLLMRVSEAGLRRTIARLIGHTGGVAERDSPEPSQYHFDPETYLDMVLAEVPDYEEFQGAVASASAGSAVSRILELGVGTGETARRVLEMHPGAEHVGIDVSPHMLAVAADVVEGAELRVGRIEDPLPPGPFDLVVTALAVHHLDSLGKANLFTRIAGVLAPHGRFVLGDVVVPVDAADVRTPTDNDHDKPDTLADQLEWLSEAGFDTEVAWQRHDLVVVVATRAP